MITATAAVSRLYLENLYDRVSLRVAVTNAYIKQTYWVGG
jgi:hypothetical protein